MMGTLGTLTALVIMVVGFHFGRMLLKEVRNNEVKRNEHRIHRMEVKLDKMKKKRADAVTLEMEVAAQGFEVS